MIVDTTSQAFFDAKYQDCEDPWGFATSSYENERYEAIMRAIGDRRYRRAFEPGCSIGVLTVKLAQICDSVEAMDISPTAVAQTRKRTQHLNHVRATCEALPTFTPTGIFDLIVFSEIGYYFTTDCLLETATYLSDRMSTSGVFLAAHWLGESPDHLLSGDTVHETLSRVPNLAPQHAERHSEFRLDVWART